MQRPGIGNKTKRLETDESKRRMALTTGFLGRGAAGTPGWLEQKICAFIKPVLLLRTMLESVNSACDFYWLFQSDSFTNKTVYWSRMYAVQKGYNKPPEQLSRKT